MYQVGINKGIILRCTAYQISTNVESVLDCGLFTCFRSDIGQYSSTKILICRELCSNCRLDFIPVQNQPKIRRMLKSKFLYLSNKNIYTKFLRSLKKGSLKKNIFKWYKVWILIRNTLPLFSKILK